MNLIGIREKKVQLERDILQKIEVFEEETTLLLNEIVLYQTIKKHNQCRKTVEIEIIVDIF